MISNLFDTGATPVLERLVQFTDARQRVLTDDIANLSTPKYQPHDLSPAEFQKALRTAVDARRNATGDDAGPLAVDDTSELKFKDQSIEVHPEPSNENIMFHDQNNRDLERIMQHLAENTLTHNAAIELLREQYGILQSAIEEKA